MDVSEDFSGLPEYKTRGEKRSERVDRIWSERRNNPYRGRRTRIILVGGFLVALLALVISLIVLFAPAPYLGTNYSSIANSVGTASEHDCKPAGNGWICTKEVGNGNARYNVEVDWAGCWSGQLMGRAAAHPDAEPKISGCVAIIDHLKAG